LLLEHPPVITLGRHADPKGVVATESLLASRGIEVHRIERGGQATYHGPGQVVGYSILDLRERRMGVGDYVRRLEEVMVRAAAHLGVTAEKREKVVGTFTASGKIGAVGVRVARGISFHGFAFNVEPDLDHFRLIVPCGMPEMPVASLESILGRSPGMPAAREALVEAYEQVFSTRLDPIDAV
ncbi:MAG: lipoyl(octanoyl) transferase LipB, partial [Phycisphaeraceae bacterium]|nr:lipoyl(octanoyl) transferase LipB [Phycisphaeraceae bacterium]